MTDQEKNNQKISAVTTFASAALIVALSFLVSCWEAPPPPWPNSNSGMILSLGTPEGTTELGSSRKAQPVSAPEDVKEAPKDEKEIFEDDKSDVRVKVDDVLDPQPDPTPDPQPDPQPNPTPDPQPNPNPDPQPDPDPNSDPDPNPNPGNSDTESKTPGDAKGSEDGEEGGDPDGGGWEGLKPGDGTGGDGVGTGGLAMDSWGWKDVPDTRAVKHTGTIKVKITVDDEGNITNIQFLGDYGAFDIEDRKAIKAAILKTGVKAKNPNDLQPAEEHGIATFIIKR